MISPSLNTRRTVHPFFFTLLCGGSLALLAGCGGAGSEEYKSFSETQSAKDNATTAVAQTENDGSPIQDENKDSENSEEIARSPGKETDPDLNLENTSAEVRLDSILPVVAEKPEIAQQLDIKILIPEKQFKVEGPERAIRVTYDDINLLKVINMEPVTPDAPEHMPGWLRSLDGRRIRIRGFMSPTFEPTGLRAFLMGRDNQACCFPGRAKIYDLFPVRMREGETVDFIDNRPFDVVGVFHINPVVVDDSFYQLYAIDDAVVIEK